MTRARQTKVVVAFLALSGILLVAGAAHSHDIWLLPDRFHLGRGETLTVRQFSGVELEDAEEIEFLRLSTPTFRLIMPDGTIDLLEDLPDVQTQPVVKPVLERQLDFDGLALVTMEHAFTHNLFSVEQFVEYLQHEEYSVDDFRGHLSTTAEIEERYSRSMKALFQVGDSTESDVFEQVLQQRIEIILLQNPYSLEVGDEIQAKVLFDGDPLVGRAVMAFSRSAPGAAVDKTTTRTDANGIVSFTLDQRGVWLLRLVHLRPCEAPVGDTCDGAGWESFWASFLFGFGLS